MKQSLTVQMVLAFIVLALAIFAYGESTSPAWWWMKLLGATLAVVVFADAWSERRERLAGPLTPRTTAFVLTDLVLPILVACAALAAFLIGGEGWSTTAVVLAIALAIVSLL